jgi:LysM repeat protein
MSVQLNLDVNDMVHIVQKGETLYGIAKIYKTTYQKLAETNEIAEPYTILEKQGIKVSIPRHIVKKGDTLYSIAKVYGTSYQKLAEYNKISAPYSLKIGQVLNLIQVYLGEIEFKDDNNNIALNCLDYILYLENGTQVLGTTDKYCVSQRLTTNNPIKIVEVSLLVEEPIFEELGELC